MKSIKAAQAKRDEELKQQIIAAHDTLSVHNEHELKYPMDYPVPAPKKRLQKRSETGTGSGSGQTGGCRSGEKVLNAHTIRNVL